MQLRVLEHAAARLAGFAALDAAVRPLFVPAAPFQHASKLVLRATARGLEPVGARVRVRVSVSRVRVSSP